MKGFRMNLVHMSTLFSIQSFTHLKRVLEDDSSSGNSLLISSNSDLGSCRIDILYETTRIQETHNVIRLIMSIIKVRFLRVIEAIRCIVLSKLKIWYAMYRQMRTPRPGSKKLYFSVNLNMLLGSSRRRHFGYIDSTSLGQLALH
ncbi:hypothetical protein Ahy_A04g020225 isoform D [Arachis hypogaea]|uniref:Uncharacterized protein n=1 Tax=Arachis hypogaea TaxID=3818 RepID=A0A445DH92_ARAHY|nr:hypothetical protein Ahy_A04g020225 isoform D [Arachis hypogaea]